MPVRTILWRLLFVCPLSGPAFAEPLEVPVRVGGAISGVASADGAVIAYNPAGVSVAGNRYWAELDGRVMSLLLLATRNEGIDPNTGEVYLPSESSEISGGGYLGAIFSPSGSPLGFGLAVQTTGLQSVDFRGEETGPYYQSHQRYGTLYNSSRTTLVTGAVGLPVIDNLHIGISASVGFDRVELVQAWDPLGFEGLGPGDDEPGLTKPYSNDALMSLGGTGRHLELSSGLMWVGDGYSIGLSYSHSNVVTSKLNGSIVVPPILGDVSVPTLAELFVHRAPLARLGGNVSPFDWMELSFNGEMALWELCCSGKDGDLKMLITDENGGSVDHDDGVSVGIIIENYFPKRLENRLALQGGVEIKVNERFNVQAEVEWRQPSVPDYAVNAMNLDFETLAVGGGLEAQVWRGVTLGFDYIEVLSIPRLITNSAWDVRVQSLSDTNPDYVDERFSPQLPYTASGNGHYESVMRTFSVRLGGSY